MISSQHISPQLVLGFLDLLDFSAQTGLQEKREIERKGAVFLLSKLLKNEQTELLYDDYGKPFLKGCSAHISLSHSHQWLLAAVHNTAEVGVDIEKVKDKIINIAPRFLSDAELPVTRNNPEQLTLYWAAKEAVYKAYGKKQLEFKSAIFIHPFEMQAEGELEATLRLKDQERLFRLYYKQYHQYQLAVTL